MRGALTIECDMCLNSIEIPINNPATFHGMPKPSDIQHILTKNGWHALKSCLCPECKTKVKENNCMNICKILLWATLLFMIVCFLFKKPKLEENK